MFAQTVRILALGIITSMVMTAGSSTASFADLREMMGAFQESRILLSAVELDIFTAVGEGATVKEVSAKLSTDPRATGLLLNALAALGALVKDHERFSNTPDTASMLVAGSPNDIRASLMHTVNLWNSWHTLTDCVRAGTAVRTPALEADDKRWTASFIAAMHRVAQTTAGQVVAAIGADGVRRLLDVGGGSGAYSIEFAKANPNLHAEVLDLDEVLSIARRHIRQENLNGRVTTRVGDLTRDEFGDGYDLILLSAICHMLGPEENQDLFRRCYRAAVPGGRIVIRDFILEPSRTAPKSAAIFGINMLVGTRSGATYTEEEYGEWLRKAGFQDVTRLEPSGDLIVASKR